MRMLISGLIVVGDEIYIFFYRGGGFCIGSEFGGNLF